MLRRWMRMWERASGNIRTEMSLATNLELVGQFVNPIRRLIWYVNSKAN